MLNYAVLQTVSLARGQKRRWLPKHQHQSDLLPELMQQLSCYVMTSIAIQLVKPNAGKMFFRCSLFFSLALTGFLLKEKDVTKAPLLTRGAMGQMVLALPCIYNGELSKLVTLDRKKSWFRHIVQLGKRGKLSKQVEYPIRHLQNGKSLGFSFIVTSNL